MTTLVDPLLPPTPMDWFVQQADQHRRTTPMTAGLVGEQPRSDWLSLASVLVRAVVRLVRRWAVVATEPMLAAVGWIQERAAVHRGGSWADLLFSYGGGAV